MCIAIIKEKGANLPSKETLEICWHNNPDGAGFMYENNGELVIDKGYMREEQFIKGLGKHEFGKDDFVVIHFRKSTSGGITPDNTHPFPISGDIDDLQKWDIRCKQAIVHNGVVGNGHKNLSDTAVFVRDCLANSLIVDNLRNSTLQNLLEAAVDGSRFLIVDMEKDIKLKLGTWKYDKDTGLWFSNDNYKKKVTTTYTNTNWSRSTNTNNSTTNTSNASSNVNTSNAPKSIIREDLRLLSNTEVTWCPICMKRKTLNKYHSVTQSVGYIYNCNECGFYFNYDEEIIKVVTFVTNPNNNTINKTEVVQDHMFITEARRKNNQNKQKPIMVGAGTE